MTREEAIHRLKNTAWLGTNKDREETEQAVDMAIEALQDRPEGEQTDLISRADAIEAVCDGCVWYKTASCEVGKEEWECSEVNKIRHLPSADAVCREDYHNLVMASNDIDRALREYQAKEETDAVDCTEFIEWLVDRVLDETIWENNSVAYGEIICRKLEKLGILEVTEEPSYYIRPSADAVHGEWIDEDGNNVPLHKDGYPLRSCYCNQCHEWLVASDEYEVKGNFCPYCGARMKGGAE